MIRRFVTAGLLDVPALVPFTPHIADMRWNGEVWRTDYFVIKEVYGKHERYMRDMGYCHLTLTNVETGETFTKCVAYLSSLFVFDKDVCLELMKREKRVYNESVCD